jgi:hypothetical protein
VHATMHPVETVKGVTEASKKTSKDMLRGAGKVTKAATEVSKDVAKGASHATKRTVELGTHAAQGAIHMISGQSDEDDSTTTDEGEPPTETGEPSPKQKSIRSAEEKYASKSRESRDKGSDPGTAHTTQRRTWKRTHHSPKLSSRSSHDKTHSIRRNRHERSGSRDEKHGESHERTASLSPGHGKSKPRRRRGDKEIGTNRRKSLSPCRSRSDSHILRGGGRSRQVPVLGRAMSELSPTRTTRSEDKDKPMMRQISSPPGPTRKTSRRPRGDDHGRREPGMARGARGERSQRSQRPASLSPEHQGSGERNLERGTGRSSRSCSSSPGRDIHEKSAHDREATSRRGRLSEDSRLESRSTRIDDILVFAKERQQTLAQDKTVSKLLREFPLAERETSAETRSRAEDEELPRKRKNIITSATQVAGVTICLTALAAREAVNTVKNPKKGAEKVWGLTRKTAKKTAEVAADPMRAGKMVAEISRMVVSEASQVTIGTFELGRDTIDGTVGIVSGLVNGKEDIKTSDKNDLQYDNTKILSRNLGGRSLLDRLANVVDDERSTPATRGRPPGGQLGEKMPSRLIQSSIGVPSCSWDK